MSEAAIARYCELLSNKIVSMFGVTKAQADQAVERSAIRELIRQAPEYVDHVPLATWAKEVHQKSLQ